MSDMIRDIMKKDITIKIISILIAIILWFSILDKNTNPTIERDIDIPIKVLNENSLDNKNIRLKDRSFPKNVRVTVEGKKDKIDSLGSNYFHAQLDMGNVRSVNDKELLIDVTYDKGDFTVVTAPKTVTLNLEKIVQGKYTVDVNQTGSLSRNYKVIRVTVVPKDVEIKGSESIIKNISKALITVNVDNFDKDYAGELPCRFFGSDGQEYTAYLENMPVNVKLEVAKEVSVVPDIKGTPARNYIITDKKVTPSKVYIIGQPEILNGINELSTEPVDVENKSSSVETRCRLRIPEGIKTYEAPNNIIVNTVIEQVGRVDFDIPQDNIEILNPEIDNTLNYVVQTQAVRITLKGNANVLKKINISSLKPNIDVSNLTEGTHKLPLNLNLPSGIRPVEGYEIEVRIDKR